MTRILVRRLSIAAAVIASIFFALTAAPAFAQPKPVVLAPTAAELATYKRHFDTATKLAQAQAFDVAAGEFEAAYAAVKNPQALRQALEAYKQLKLSVKATQAAKRLLQDHAKDLKPKEKKDLVDLVAQLAPSIGQIELKASEPSADVLVDGQPAGTTPLPAPLDLDIGAHKLSLKKAGFEQSEKDVVVASRHLDVVDVTMEKEIVSGKVTVSERSGTVMDVVVDGKVVGPTPWTGDLSLGAHEVAGKSPTAEAPSQKFDVVKRKPLTVELVAVPTVGKLEVSIADGKGVILVDAKAAGEGKASIDLPVGQHTLVVARPGFVRVERLVDIVAGKSVAIALVLEPAKPVVAPEVERPYEGVYGGVIFAGLLQPGATGNQLQVRCGDVGGPCTDDSTKGGGILGFAGYTWRYIGVDLLFGGSGDVSSPGAVTPGGGHSGYDIYRLGGLAALRVRAAVQTHSVRAALAVGGGLSERWVGAHSTTTDYTSLLGLVDGSFALRTSPTTAIAVGALLIAEHAGYGAYINVPESRTPFLLFTGPQYLAMPYIGLQFGP